ncbi:Abhydrolase domain-containing protein C22H12.03 [Psilocybe cubensis]|nr:Abhydrolase domain-containing protein C22H12.03 [Psilocybe cubensis]KAH9481824.1 Abhydrolase domain-containing protein C22H12.03 [Psilocybe cubensis]
MPTHPIYALDLRNHGTSPHATPMTYEAMAGDVHAFIQERGMKDVSLLGHSMGGKVAMSYALSLEKWNVSPGTLGKLIIADIAPSIGNLSPEFIRYIGAMQKIEALPFGKIKTRTDADHILQAYESDVSVRQFLLTNLRLPHAHEPSKAKFIVPLSILSKSMEALGSFPYEFNAADNIVPVTFDGPTLAIKGTKSPYINHKNIPALRAFFPNVQLEELDANHWVHAEKPHEFKKLVVDFLNDN